MDNNVLLILTGAAMILGIILIKRVGLASKSTALRLIAQGATVIDVRTKREYEANRLSDTVNIPLDQIRDRVEAVAPDRSAPVLLHCLSGTRSDTARRLLKHMGYSQAYNLGSIMRARRLLNRARERSAGRRIPGERIA